MIGITKEQAMRIREKYPNACIVKTVHNRCVEESERYLQLIPDNIEAAELLKQFERDRKYM